MSLVGPFPASAVIARLQELPELRLVEGAAGLQSALESAPRALPAAFVLVEETGSAPGDYTAQFAQPITATVRVVLYARHAGGAAKAAAEMEAIERAVRTKLRDWSPAYPFEPLWVTNSGGDQFFGAQITRQVNFKTQYRDQEQP